jgi:hypothetical protein
MGIVKKCRQQGHALRSFFHLVPRELVLKKRTCQLTLKHGKVDGLACVCALCLKVQLKTLLVAIIEVLEGLLESVHRSRPTCTRMGRSSNLLLAIKLIPKEEQ